MNGLHGRSLFYMYCWHRRRRWHDCWSKNNHH